MLWFNQVKTTTPCTQNSVAHTEEGASLSLVTSAAQVAMTGLLVLLVGVLFGGLQSGVLAQNGGKVSFPRALERLESLVASLNGSLHETKEDLQEVRLSLNQTKKALGEVQGEKESLKVALQETRSELAATKTAIKQNIARSSALAAEQQKSIDRLTTKVTRQGQSVNQLNDSVTDQEERLDNLTWTVEEQGTCTARLKDDVERIRMVRITDCYDAMMMGYNESGVYTIQLRGSRNVYINVYCDMETDGGGWTVLLKRQDGSVDFYRNWTDYKRGFGNLEGEHWLGMDNMYLLTHQSSDPPQLRVDLADWEGNTSFAKYAQFSVGDEDSEYTLSVSGYQSASTAGDSLMFKHNGWRFSTLDRDNDIVHVHCAVYFHGPWWHSACYASLLTGKYYTSGPRLTSPFGINWNKWHGNYYSLRVAEMKIRPGGV